jgi:hypothetical protein
VSSQAFALTLMVFTFAATAAQATPTDPHIRFGAAVAGVPITSVDAFNFHANGKGGGVFNFENVSPNDWVGVDLFITLKKNSTIGCEPVVFFAACEFTAMPGKTPAAAVYDIDFDEPTTVGITNGTVFSINLNDLVNNKPNKDPKGSGGWGADAMLMAVTTVAPAIPEPASLVLLGSGMLLIGTIAGLRRRRSS